MAAECGCAALVGLAAAGLPLARGRLQGRRAEGPAQSQDQRDSVPDSSTAEPASAAIGLSDGQAAGQELGEARERPEAGDDRAALGQERICELERFREQVLELESRLRDAEDCSGGLRQQLTEERLKSEQHQQDTMELRVKAEVLQEQLEHSTVEVSKLSRLQREQADHVLEIRRLKSEAAEREIVCQAQALELEHRALAATLAEQAPGLQDEACSTLEEQDDDGVDMAERSEEEREEEEGASPENLRPEVVGSPASPQLEEALAQAEEALAQAEARASEFDEGWRRAEARAAALEAGAEDLESKLGHAQEALAQAEARASESDGGWQQAEARASEFEEGWRQAEARASELEEGWRRAEARAAALEAGAEALESRVEELESKLGRAQEQAASAGGTRLEALLQRAARAEGRADALAQKVKDLCTAESGPRLPRVPEESPVPTGSSGTSVALGGEAGDRLAQWDASRLDKKLSHGERRALRQRLAAAEARAAAAEAREKAARGDLAAAQEAAEVDRRSLQCELEEMREKQLQCNKATEKEKDLDDKERGDLWRQQFVQSQELVQTWRRIGEQVSRCDAVPEEPGRVSPPIWRHPSPSGQRTFLQASPTRATREPRASAAPTSVQASPREPRTSGALSTLLSTPSVVRVATVRHSTPPRSTVTGTSTV